MDRTPPNTSASKDAEADNLLSFPLPKELEDQLDLDFEQDNEDLIEKMLADLGRWHVGNKNKDSQQEQAEIEYYEDAENSELFEGLQRQIMQLKQTLAKMNFYLGEIDKTQN